MWLMLHQEVADDFVIATVRTHSVREFLVKARQVAELKVQTEDYVDVDSNMFRPAEVNDLCEYATKQTNVLSWSPPVDFDM